MSESGFHHCTPSCFSRSFLQFHPFMEGFSLSSSRFVQPGFRSGNGFFRARDFPAARPVPFYSFVFHFRLRHVTGTLLLDWMDYFTVHIQDFRFAFRIWHRHGFVLDFPLMDDNGNRFGIGFGINLDLIWRRSGYVPVAGSLMHIAICFGIVLEQVWLPFLSQYHTRMELPFFIPFYTLSIPSPNGLN